MKKCGRCGLVKSRDQFTRDASRKDGLLSRCRDCSRERAKAWKQANPERHREHQARWRKNNPEKMAAGNARSVARQAARRHGGRDEWARMHAAQDGCCYLCGRPFELGDSIVVDHDHDCHPSTRARTESCATCRRGLAHAGCNQLIGLAGEDMDVLRAIIANFEPVRDATKARVAAKRDDVPALF